MSKPQNNFEIFYSQKITPGSQRSKTTPKSRQNQMPEMKKEKQSCCTIGVDHKTFLNKIPTAK